MQSASKRLTRAGAFSSLPPKVAVHPHMIHQAASPVSSRWRGIYLKATTGTASGLPFPQKSARQLARCHYLHIRLPHLEHRRTSDDVQELYVLDD